MGRAIKVNPVDSHMSENLESPYSNDKRIRLERRWRRREAMNNSLKHNCFTTATKTTAKTCGNTAVLIDKNVHLIDEDADEDWLIGLSAYTGDNGGEMDEDSRSFLPTHDPDIQTDCASNHSDGSNGNKNDIDEVDADYASFLATYNHDIETDCASNHSGDSNINKDSDEVDADYASYLAAYNHDIETDCASNHSGDSNIDKDSDEMDADYASYLAACNHDIETDCASNHSGDSNINKDSDEVDADYASFLRTHDPDIETGCASNHSGGSNGNNNDSDEMDADYGSFLPTNDPDIETYCASNHSGGLVSDVEFNEDYEQFLNSVTIVDGDKEYFRDKNATNTSNVEDDSNSSDSDLIILDSFPICGNTSFVSSKTYDSSCFGEETNPEDNKQIAAYDHSLFRRTLMECLERPYDQEEYDDLLLKVSKRTKKERHLETRQGVVKLYHCDGLSKSYLDMHPDLVKAIAEFKEQHRVLFLLRGFFFWLQKVSLVGRFQPWRDETCLEILRKM